MLNRAITDLKVLEIITQWRRSSGGTWSQTGVPIFEVGKDYRLTVKFGNTQPPVSWPGDEYDKLDMRVTLEPIGIQTGNRIIGKQALQYFASPGFVSALDRPPPFEYPGPYKSTEDPLTFRVYLRATPVVASFPITRYKFAASISAAIRRSRSHQVKMGV